MWYSEDQPFESGLRVRYKLGAKIPLKLEASEKYIYFPLSVEWFMDVGPRVSEFFSDDLRVAAGIGWVFDYVWVGEFQVILQRSRTGTGMAYESDDIIYRVSVKHLWSAIDYMSRED